MSELLGKSKKELVEIIDQMVNKLSVVKDAEKKMDLSDTDLNGVGFGVFKDSTDRFHFVELAYDVETGKATVKEKKPLDTSDHSIALYNGKKFLVERLFNKEQLNHNKGK